MTDYGQITTQIQYAIKDILDDKEIPNKELLQETLERNVRETIDDFTERENRTCSNCGRRYHPDNIMCPHCGDKNYTIS